MMIAETLALISNTIEEIWEEREVKFTVYRNTEVKGSMKGQQKDGVSEIRCRNKVFMSVLFHDRKEDDSTGRFDFK